MNESMVLSVAECYRQAKKLGLVAGPRAVGVTRHSLAWAIAFGLAPERASGDESGWWRVSRDWFPSLAQAIYCVSYCGQILEEECLDWRRPRYHVTVCRYVTQAQKDAANDLKWDYRRASSPDQEGLGQEWIRMSRQTRWPMMRSDADSFAEAMKANDGRFIEFQQVDAAFDPSQASA